MDYVMKKEQTPITREDESAYIAEAIKALARLERTVKFKFIVKNKNLTPAEVAGPIMETVIVNGKRITVCTNVTEDEVRRFQEDRFLMFMFG